MPASKIFHALLLAGLCAVATPLAWADAQADRLPALERRLESSVLLIERLSARIAELERGAKPAPATSTAGATAAQAQTIAALQDSVSQLSDGLSRRGTDSGLAVHGFADVGAAWSSGNDPVKLRGFNGGTLDLYLTPQFGERVKGLVEIAVEYGEDGGVAVDLERLQLGYTVSDSLTLWLGRFHTPFGIWNTAYHHGANLQTSIFRPRFIDFEDKGGIVAAHSVGAWASGRTALGAGRLTYDAYIANGPRIAGRTLDFNAFSDDGSNKLIGINLGYQAAGALDGLSVGVHAFGAKAKVYADSANVLSETRLRMAGAYFGYDEGDWEAIGEYYHFANVDLGANRRHASHAGFVQLGKAFGAWTPFVRWEKAAFDADDNYFRSQASGRSYRRASVGLRYVLDPKSSLKFEVGSTRESAVDLIDESGAPVPFAARNYRRGAFQFAVAF